jgi:hypothetical protein
MRADVFSILLHSNRMVSVRDAKEIRRHNLSLLMDLYGQAELAKDTDVQPAYLFQMSKGVGKQARGISDKNARIIDSGASLPDGWLDIDRRNTLANVIEVDIKAAKLRRASAWPFRTIDRERFERLDEGDRLRVEGAMIKAIVAIENSGPPIKRTTRTLAK